MLLIDLTDCFGSTDPFPPDLNRDFGTPLGLCKETGTSGVFTREFSKATVKMDCSDNTPTITMK